MQEHHRLDDDISEDEANLVFNNATWKVIKDAFKHARYIYVTTYYKLMNLVLLCMHVLKLLVFYFDMQM
jgi:magnesium-transporting ATPase (P-type)